MNDRYSRQTESVKQVLIAAGLEDGEVPDDAALQVHFALVQRLRAQISKAGGMISFAEFMQQALYEPAYGYYVAGCKKFGEAGDFVTAPEISPLFGHCIANQVMQVNQQIQSKTISPAVLEIGPGSGALCVSVLKQLEEKNCLPEYYALLEVSPELTQRQQQHINQEIPHLQTKIKWLDKLPERFNGVVIANEVIDAMAVERFRMKDGQIEQLCVSASGDDFDWVYRPASVELTTPLREMESRIKTRLDNGYTSEINTWINPWITSLAQMLNQGLLLLIDYGYPEREYYHPQRTAGTLMCHYRHRAHDNPLILAGLQDITAYVNFSMVAEAGFNAGLEVKGFAPQAQFLLGCGLDTMLGAEAMNDPLEFAKMTQQVKWLTLPGEMGERFKALALTKSIDGNLIGFSMINHVHRL